MMNVGVLAGAAVVGWLLAGVLLYLGRRMVRGHGHGPYGATVAAVSIATAFVTLRGLPPTVPRSDLDRILLWVLPLVWLVQCFDSWLPVNVWLWRWVVGILGMRLVLHGSVYVSAIGQATGTAWSTEAMLLQLGTASCIACASWFASDMLSRHRSAFRTGYTLALACLASSVASLVGGYISCAEHLVALGAVALAIAMLGVPQGRERAAAAAEGVVWFVWLSLLAAARYFAELPPWAALMLILAPATAWVGVLVGRLPSSRRGTVATMYAVPMLVLAGALGLLLWSYHHKAASTRSRQPSPTMHDYLQFGR